MKRLFKFRLPKQQSAAVGAGAGLFLLSALLILFGIFYAGREVLMVGLIGALPALVQLILLLPQDKLDRLRELSAQEHNVLAVGDGINDALALREADVGIAMGAMGSDLAIESADIALMNNNLENIPFVISLAKRTRKIIYQNLVLSVCISLIMLALSAFGVISALAGSILHNCGAFAVLLNSSRILKEESGD